MTDATSSSLHDVANHSWGNRMTAQLTHLRAQQPIEDPQRDADADAVGQRRRGAASSVKPGPAHKACQEGDGVMGMMQVRASSAATACTCTAENGTRTCISELGRAKVGVCGSSKGRLLAAFWVGVVLLLGGGAAPAMARVAASGVASAGSGSPARLVGLDRRVTSAVQRHVSVSIRGMRPVVTVGRRHAARLPFVRSRGVRAQGRRSSLLISPAVTSALAPAGVGAGGHAAASQLARATIDPACIVQGAYETCSYPFTGQDAFLTVPDLTSPTAFVEAAGGSGGDASTVNGGFGAYLSGYITVAGGDQLLIAPGGKGSDPTPDGASGGWPDGGAAGLAGAGGGSSHVSLKRSGETSFTPFLYAAGGGGAGGEGGTDYPHTCCATPPLAVPLGGGGGDASSAGEPGQGGTSQFCSVVTGGNPGQGGSGTAGGAGGAEGTSCDGGGISDIAGDGADGALAPQGGGRGGGGLYGGGGGGAGGPFDIEVHVPDPELRLLSGAGGGGGGGASGYFPTVLSQPSGAVWGIRGDGFVHVLFAVGDITPPVTTIDSAPMGTTDLTDATIAFTGSDNSGADGIDHFECQLDGGGFAPCASPATYSGLSVGAHSFEVYAVDRGGNDSTTAQANWTVSDAADPSTCTTSGTVTTCPYPFTSGFSYRTWTVPAGVTHATITADGAGGGADLGPGGGLGGRVQARVPVTPGETLRIYLGAKGLDGFADANNCTEAAFNGGGFGACSDQGAPAGGGGGGSDVRRSPFALADRIVVAGGGGGGGGSGAGGAGGGAAGDDGGGDSVAGGGGTQTGGGTAGATDPQTNCYRDPQFIIDHDTADAGTLGAGGGGADCGRGGGGGGGGYYGGGGGGASTTFDSSGNVSGETGGGGGGGSSYADPTATDVTLTTGGGQSGDGQVQIASSPAVSQTINVTTHAPPSAAYGTSFTVAATGGGSPNPVTYAGSGACSNTGPKFTMTSSTGTCTVTYDQAGDDNYDPAPQVQESVTAQKASQAIRLTSAPPASPVYGGSYTVTATGGASGNSVVFSIDRSSSAGACSISGAKVLFTSAGSCVIDANQAGNASYAPAPQVQQTLTIVYSKTVSGNSSASLTVTAGQGVLIAPGARVNAPVNVLAGGSLDIEGATVTGPLTATGGVAITACGSTIPGPVTITADTGQVTFGDGGSCAGNTITGPVKITGGNGTGVTFDNNTVTGPLTITHNKGTINISHNKVTGPTTTTPNP